MTPVNIPDILPPSPKPTSSLIADPSRMKPVAIPAIDLTAPPAALPIGSSHGANPEPNSFMPCHALAMPFNAVSRARKAASSASSIVRPERSIFRSRPSAKPDMSFFRFCQPAVTSSSAAPRPARMVGP
ncbi:hypothetical protein D3C80_1626240 [compost metagenome]